MNASCLLPLGGTEINSGYKGFGLGLMVELFCGILAGSAYGPNIRKWMTATTPANLGQCFVAVDPSCFAPGFEERLSDIISQIKNLTPVDPSNPILIAGEPEIAHMGLVEAAGGIRYHINQINGSKQMAQKLGVQEMRSIA
jgi:LDH2 family malate/lactate/ureidoglycolate dehydrogenase